MAEHIFACDDASLDPRIKHNLPLFYAAADTPNHELWCSFLTDDVVIKKGASEMKGKDGWTHSAVMAFRKVAKKEISESTDKSVHMLYKVFPFGHAYKQNKRSVTLDFRLSTYGQEKQLTLSAIQPYITCLISHVMLPTESQDVQSLILL
ncbi:unnamed protein product [Fusarium graminearum]|nr:unnamed protein product [Fusarium graminearum]CAF3611778.1 unnamed protein product [Fusarium graminearum]CAG1992960.1 unnamed protein product [Fusarium graminearum]